MVIVVSGEVFITNDEGEERRLGQGDIAFFPAGSSYTWRVTYRIKKIAVLRKDIPSPLGLGVLAWHSLLRMTGIRGQSPFAPAHP
jgi:uncharacterized protein